LPSLLSSAGWWLSVLREFVAVCARFGRMVASGGPAATSEATTFDVRLRDVVARVAHITSTPRAFEVMYSPDERE
jgi:hypothetical protein